MRDDYLLAGQDSELERLRIQARVWEPAGQELLKRLPYRNVRHAVDVGCGAMGLLRPLSAWVGPSGTVIGTDVDERLLAAAGQLVVGESLNNVELVRDDIFQTSLEPESFDLVHSRFLLAPLGRVQEQLSAYAGLLAPNGWLVLEEPDSSSWCFTPDAPATEALIGLIREAFAASGGNLDAGLGLGDHLPSGYDERLEAKHVVSLEPLHPYLRLPLQFAESLEPRLLKLVSRVELASLRSEAERELSDPQRSGTTFTLMQLAARKT